MPHAKERGRDGHHRVRGKGVEGERCSQRGVLHTHFESDRLLLSVPEAGGVDLEHEAREQVPECVAAEIVKHHHRDDERSFASEQLLVVYSNHGADDNEDRHLRNGGQNSCHLADFVPENGVNRNAEHHRDEHYLERRLEQIAGGNINVLAG